MRNPSYLPNGHPAANVMHSTTEPFRSRFGRSVLPQTIVRLCNRNAYTNYKDVDYIYIVISFTDVDIAVATAAMTGNSSLGLPSSLCYL